MFDLVVSFSWLFRFGKVSHHCFYDLKCVFLFGGDVGRRVMRHRLVKLYSLHCTDCRWRISGEESKVYSTMISGL